MIVSIIEGHIRSRLNIRTDIMIYREEEYCKKCPVSHVKGTYTGVCKKKNLGCGCKTKALTSQNVKACPMGFWTGTTFEKQKFDNYCIAKNFIK